MRLRRATRHVLVAAFLDHLKDKGALRWWMRVGRFYLMTGFDGEALGPYSLRQAEEFVNGWRESSLSR